RRPHHRPGLRRKKWGPAPALPAAAAPRSPRAQIAGSCLLLALRLHSYTRRHQQIRRMRVHGRRTVVSCSSVSFTALSRRWPHISYSHVSVGTFSILPLLLVYPNFVVLAESARASNTALRRPPYEHSGVHRCLICAARSSACI